MSVHVFLDASVTPRHASVGAFLILKNELDNYELAQLKPKLVKLSLQSSVLATFELAIEVLETVAKMYPNDSVILYTNCYNLSYLHSIRRYDPLLLIHRNYRDLYKPLLDLLENVKLVKVHSTDKTRESEILKLVFASTQIRSKL